MKVRVHTCTRTCDIGIRDQMRFGIYLFQVHLIWIRDQMRVGIYRYLFQVQLIWICGVLYCMYKVRSPGIKILCYENIGMSSTCSTLGDISDRK